MILVLAEDHVLNDFDSTDDVSRSVEALDAEECLVAAFDEYARPYTIEWLRPNQYGRSLYGLSTWCENGAYRLVTCGAADPAKLLRVIQSAASIEPRSAEGTVREIERRLTGMVSD